MLSCFGCRSNISLLGQSRCQHFSVDERSRQSIASDVKHALKVAEELENRQSSECVDWYYRAAVESSQFVSAVSTVEDRSFESLHYEALTKLIETSQSFKRYDPILGICVHVEKTPVQIPIVCHNFVWQPIDFEILRPVKKGRNHRLKSIHTSPGLGLPIVVMSCSVGQRPLLVNQPTFAATAILETVNLAQVSVEKSSTQSCSAIHLYDPLRTGYVVQNGQVRALAKDTSAPILERLSVENSSILADFVSPASATKVSRLYMLEPYQPGKIPIVLIHGLLSDPFTWSDMINEMQANDAFVDQFQIWVFEYPTGQSFMESAKTLRNQLSIAQQIYGEQLSSDCHGEMILVGHSLGGLIAKLQVTHSDNNLWSAVSKLSVEELNASTSTKQILHDSFFFEPSQKVSRVIYIGTPHRGSGLANRFIGRVASSLVEQPPAINALHESLIRCNPANFSKEVTRRLPTSIDLLEPTSPILNAIQSLRLKEGLHQHSIIGDGRWTVGFGPSDGVVPVSSAQEPASESNYFVNEKHSDLNKDLDAIQEVIRICKQSDQNRSPMNVVNAFD